MESEKEIGIHFDLKQPLVTDKFTFISTYDFRLTEQELEKAHRNLKETEERRIKCLQELKERIGSDKGVKYRTDDYYLLCYLRYCKFDCEKAHKVLRNFYSIRKKYAEYFVLPPDLKTLFSRGVVTCLPYTDEEGHVLLWTKFIKWKLDEISFTQLIQLIFIFSDIIAMNPKCQINGCVSIWDFRGFHLDHMKLMAHPSILWLFANVIQNCYPWRTSRVVLINCNKYVRACYNGVRYLLKKKIADRIKLIGSDMEELHENINPHILPKEYGGYLEESECRSTDFADKILGNVKYLEYERTFGIISES